MRKQDIEKVSTAVRDARDAMQTETQTEGIGFELPNRKTNQIFDSLSRSLADVLAKQNPKFQRSKFLAQCGVERP